MFCNRVSTLPSPDRGPELGLQQAAEAASDFPGGGRPAASESLPSWAPHAVAAAPDLPSARVEEATSPLSLGRMKLLRGGCASLRPGKQACGTPRGGGEGGVIFIHSAFIFQILSLIKLISFLCKFMFCPVQRYISLHHFENKRYFSIFELPITFLDSYKMLKVWSMVVVSTVVFLYYTKPQSVFPNICLYNIPKI